MPILYVMFVLILVGIGLWAVNTYLPMDPKIKTILNIVVIVLVIFWLLFNVFGISSLGNVPRVTR